MKKKTTLMLGTILAIISISVGAMLGYKINSLITVDNKSIEIMITVVVYYISIVFTAKLTTTIVNIVGKIVLPYIPQKTDKR